jgi:hypothetical protein
LSESPKETYRIFQTIKINENRMGFEGGRILITLGKANRREERAKIVFFIPSKEEL